MNHLFFVNEGRIPDLKPTIEGFNITELAGKLSVMLYFEDLKARKSVLKEEIISLTRLYTEEINLL
ncbi:hypothetical protein KGF86_00870 [Ornithinibacillus massiliensis]|uniref:Uncharacterized protein n=1 Tax=Ornithinibacillus massiliensis TaxID=1944633 RepID=A0ABS5M8X1_9BACI|nr:hypothetical protein [Ornithinibacillus massiliensis]MBS3678759.1 hypothetical protein [Ornithinibacillus massiliensis]